jgi:predicted metal-dependent hydrolase
MPIGHDGSIGLGRDRGSALVRALVDRDRFRRQGRSSGRPACRGHQACVHPAIIGRPQEGRRARAVLRVLVVPQAEGGLPAAARVVQVKAGRVAARAALTVGTDAPRAGRVDQKAAVNVLRRDDGAQSRLACIPQCVSGPASMVTAMPPAIPPAVLSYLAGYPGEVQAQVQDLLASGRLGERLRDRYGDADDVHEVRTDGALYDYTMALKNRHLRNAQPLSKVVFDNRLHVIANALGTHTTVARVQGNKLKAKREIRIAGMFRAVPEAFLKMIVTHELAHLKERAHDKAFYALCTHIEPEYHQLEFDLRLYLTLVDATGKELWSVKGESSKTTNPP